MDKQRLAGLIDHTVLKPETEEEQIRILCAEAKAHGFAAVCVNPCWVSLAGQLLCDSGVAVATVVGFPLGANLTAIKVQETQLALEQGATEIDMVMNIGWLRSGKGDAVQQDIQAVKKAAGNRIVKVILETCLLSPAEIETACLLSLAAGADYVKTSTGFGSGGATVDAVRLMRETVGPDIGVKASGGVRSFQDAVAMVEAGATRIGTSSGVSICS